MKKSGFTVIELLIVVGIISLVAVVAFFSIAYVIPKSQAVKVISDFNQTREAFRLWMADTQLFLYPKETVYATGTPPFPCETEPPLSNSDLFSNVSGRAGWNGPYLVKVPRNPWGNEYLYDNDDDTYDFTSANKRKGVNFRLAWCNSADGKRHHAMVKYIDEVVDNNDGSETGFVRWSTDVNDGVINILLSPNESAQ